jgi:signal transduction histidine kinase
LYASRVYTGATSAVTALLLRIGILIWAMLLAWGADKLVASGRLPGWSVRLRLTLLYGGLFLVSGAALLATTYVLVRRATDDPVVVTTKTAIAPTRIPGRAPRNPLPSLGELEAQAEQDRRRAQEAADRQHANELHQLLLQSALALGMMSVVSIGLGWLVAGRVLRPVQSITAATQRISQHNLNERLALQGPADELKELADTIDGLLERLEAAFDAQKRFVANASHELRTPLAMMRTSLDVASAKPDPVPAHVNALERKLREGLDQADRLLESFLILARAEHGVLPEQTVIAIRELVSEALDARSDAIAARGLAVQTALADVQAEGSRTLLARMIGNVIDNAIRYNDPHGWIRIETATTRETVQLVVENGGARLEERKVRDLAQPFRRLAADRIGSRNGVGLGLSIVAAIAVAHGGTLQLNARAEGGLRVEIDLPAVAAKAVAGEPA